MKRYYTPKKGIKVRNPATGGHIPAEGAELDVNSYLNRRVTDGDLSVKVAPDAESAESKKEKKETPPRKKTKTGAK